MLRAGVHLQLGQLLAGEPVAGEHALHGQADDLFGTAVEHLLQRPRLQAAGIAGVPVVELLGALLARHRDLLGVDDDHEVARVDVRRVLRLALAAQRVGDLRGEPPEGLARRIDDVPVALGGGRLGDVGLHGVKRAARYPARAAEAVDHDRTLASGGPVARPWNETPWASTGALARSRAQAW